MNKEILCIKLVTDEKFTSLLFNGYRRLIPLGQKRQWYVAVHSTISSVKNEWSYTSILHGLHRNTLHVTWLKCQTNNDLACFFIIDASSGTYLKKTNERVPSKLLIQHSLINLILEQVTSTVERSVIKTARLLYSRLGVFSTEDAKHQIHSQPTGIDLSESVSRLEINNTKS